MNCYSVMEIAAATGFVPDLRRTECGQQAEVILGNKQVRRYYEEFYPTRLPQLFRHRLAGRACFVENDGAVDVSGCVLAFLSLDRRFMSLEDGVLLRMFDSFVVDGFWFSDVAEFTEHWLRAPDARDPRSLALREFSVFMQFCFDLQDLLKQVKSQPLLQSMFWNHYAYWFEILGERLQEEMNRALSSFLEWKPPGGQKDAAEAVRTYVQQGQAVLQDLTSRQYATTVEEALQEASMIESMYAPEEDKPLIEDGNIFDIVCKALWSLGELRAPLPQAAGMKIAHLAFCDPIVSPEIQIATAMTVAINLDKIFMQCGAQYVEGIEPATVRQRLALELIEKDNTLHQLSQVIAASYVFSEGGWNYNTALNVSG
jgi:hypothetical protein